MIVDGYSYQYHGTLNETNLRTISLSPFEQCLV